MEANAKKNGKQIVAKDFQLAKHRHCHLRHWSESSVQLAETSTVVASEVFHLMPFASIFGNQGITFMHSGNELVVFRLIMHLKT